MTPVEKAPAWLFTAILAAIFEFGANPVQAQEPPPASVVKAPAEPEADTKLRFNFRFQRWSDVLEWFADQAHLSLVLDTPPPGTFNYSDGREYSVSEALDLLNGVLSTKGYTLIRREKMLLVVNVADGIPETLVPRIELAELEKRGKFELVSMLFKTGRRNAEDVVREIAPLLGPQGKSLPLPKTNQVLVIDSAGVMRAIHAVIESMPESDNTKEAAATEKPELVVYPLKSADPDAAVKVLEALMPAGRFVRDPKANQLSAYATPSEQVGVKRVLEQMQASDGPAEQQSRFEVYALDEGDSKQALQTLQPLVPGARLSADPTSKKIAAWGTPADHEILKKAVAQLGRGGTDDNRQLEVYRLTKVDPVSVSVVLQNLVPRARLSVDPPTRSIVALASLADQKIIAATLEQLEPKNRDPNAPELRFYPLAGPAAPASLVTALQTMAPKAQVSVDNAAKRLVVVATPADHKIVKEAFDQFEKDAPNEEKRQLVLYPVSAAQRKRFQAVLADLVTEFPTVKVVTDAEPGELAIWARPAEHKVIAEVIEKLKQQAPTEDAYRLVAYSIKSADPTSVLSVLQNLFPSTKIFLDAKTRRIVAWTRAAEHEAIRSLIEQVDLEGSAESRNQLMIYPFTGADPTAAITTLKSLAPDAILTSDTKAGTIVAWARKADHSLIAPALERMQPNSDPQRRPHVVAYSVGASDPITLAPLVATLVPAARVAPNAKNGTLAIWASPEDHETIRLAIDEMTKNGALDSAAQVIAYPLKIAEPVSVVGMMQTLFPASRMTYDTKNKRLLVFGRPAEQQQIKTTLEQMDRQGGAETKRQLSVYPLLGADLTATLTMLKMLVPDTTLTSDVKAGTIVAWGLQADLDQIAPAIERMQPTSDPKRRPSVVAYPVGASDPTTLGPLVTALVPTARVVPNAKNGTLAIWASPEDHETIRLAIDEITKNGALDSAAQVIAYPLKVAEPISVVGMMQTLFPTSRMTYDAKNKRLLVFGRPAEHQQIKATLEQMDAQAGPESKRQLSVYPLLGADLTATLTMLKMLVPDTTITSDAKAGTIVAWGTQADLDQIAPAIERMQPNADPKRRPRVVAYSVGAADPALLAPLVATLVPTARAVPNAKTGTIAVWATPEDHVTISAAIEEMTARRADDNGAKVVVYTLKSMRAANAIQALQPTVPEARLGTGAGLNSHKLVAFARPADQAVIRSALDEIDQEELEKNPPELKTYPIATADPPTLLNTLQALFAGRGDVRLSLDAKTNKVVAMAPPYVQDAIRGVIEELERGSPIDANTKLEVHPLRNADPDVVLQVLNKLVTKQSARVLLSVDAKTRQLMAVASPEQQVRIRETIEHLQAAPRQFEVLQLEIVEPMTAQLAIEKLFSDANGSGKSPNAPVVDSDAGTQRLYVRANKEQLEQIRELLVKMGETNLATAADGSGRGLRVIQFSGDTHAALAEVQRVWPQLSKHPLRILQPRELSPKLLPKLPRDLDRDIPQRGTLENPAEPLPKKDDGKSDLNKTLFHSPSPLGEGRVRALSSVRNDSSPQTSPTGPNDEVLEVKTAAQDEPAQQSVVADKEKHEDAEEDRSPIIVAPGNDKITIMSDDPEAIKQLEALLRTLSPPSGSGGRDVMVFPLHSASSVTVAEILQKIFRRGSSGFGDSSSVTIAADQRLNAIVVYGGRNDRATVERLLKTLDSDDVPDSLVANRPNLIPVKNTQAALILQMLKDVYKTQLTSGGVKQPIPVPSGASVEVAAVIQQINTAAAGPLMTLGVDETTNSIVIMAPGPLVKEVTDLVHELDDAALNDSSRGVRIVKLKSTSALRVKEILDVLIKDALKRKGAAVRP